MNFIGNIIKEYRAISCMSRKALAENICTEKYVYLIEKGQRTPSTEMVRLFSDRLGVSLFDYVQYLDCQNPIEIRKTINGFNMYRRNSDFEAVQRLTEKVIGLPDFQHKPWLYEIEINKNAQLIFMEENYQEAIAGIVQVLEQMEPSYSKSIYAANLYVLLSTCYQLTGEVTKARETIFSAYEIIRGKQENSKYEQVIIAVKISAMTMHYLLGEFDEAIREGNELVQYQKRYNSYEQIHYAVFYLAFAYYKKGCLREAMEFFKKAIYLVMIWDKHLDVSYIASQEPFVDLMKDKRMDPELANAFIQKYNHIIMKKDNSD